MLQTLLLDASGEVNRDLPLYVLGAGSKAIPTPEEAREEWLDLLDYFSNGRFGAKKPHLRDAEPSTIELTESGVAWVKPASYKALEPHETLSKVGLGHRKKRV